MSPDINIFYLPNNHMKKFLLKSKDIDIQNAIIEVYKYTDNYKKQLPNNIDLSARIILIKNNIELKCKYCNNNKKFSKSAYKWSDYCGRKCSKIDSVINAQKTMIKKYGSKSYLGTKEFKDLNIKSHTLKHITNIEYFYNKYYIENNFIEKDNKFNKKAFMKFFKCNQTTANKKLIDLKIKYTVGNTGFNKDIPGILYYICIDNKYFKIGITNYSVKERFKQEHRRFKILFTHYFKKGIDAYHQEQLIIKKYKKYLIDKTIKVLSDGNTEIFNQDILRKINE